MNRHRTARWLRGSTVSLGTILLLLKGMLPTEVWAAQSKSQEDKGSPASTVAAESPDGDTLEEVVVTAEKRAEGLQNIPIAITAISGNTL